jgi:hypothetical protein
MKTPRLIGLMEDTASTQANRFVRIAKKQYNRLMRSAGKTTAIEQKRYLRAAQKTVASAEKTIGEMKKKIAQARKTLGLGKTQAKRRTRKKTARKTRARKKRI